MSKLNTELPRVMLTVEHEGVQFQLEAVRRGLEFHGSIWIKDVPASIRAQLHAWAKDEHLPADGFIFVIPVDDPHILKVETREVGAS